MLKHPAVTLAKETYSEWSGNKASHWAAALAYYAIFSLAPTLLITIAIAGLAFGQSSARDQIMARVSAEIGATAAGAVEGLLKGAQKPSAGIIAAALGFLMLLWAASNLFGCLQDALHTFWRIRPAPGAGFVHFLKGRFLAALTVLGIGLIFLLSLTASAVLSAMSRYITQRFGVPASVLSLADILISVAVFTVMFALLFRFLPFARAQWRHVWLGGILTSILFTLGKVLIGFYLARSSTGSTYGAAGSLVLLLLWINYSAQILFLGAEFIYVYARRYGDGIPPAKGATRSDEGVA